MPVQNIQSVQYDDVLTRLATGDANDLDKLTFKQVCPRVEHNQDQAYIVIQDPEWTLRLHSRMDLLAGGGDAEPLVLAGEYGGKRVQIHIYHLAAKVDTKLLNMKRDGVRLLMPDTPPDQLATSSLVHQMLSIQENHFIETITNNALYNASNYTTVAAADRWDLDTVNPLTLLDTAADQIRLSAGRPMNTFICSDYIWRRLRKNPYLRSALGFGENLVTIEAFEKEILMGGKIVWNEMRYWTADEGAAGGATARVSGTDCVLAYVKPDGAKGLMPGQLPKTYLSEVNLKDEYLKVFKAPFRFNDGGYYVILRHSWAFVDSSPDTISTNLINTGYLFETCVS